MRTTGSSGAVTSEAIREASLDLIYKHGFEAASLRKLAQKVGIQPGSLYNYFKNKEDLLIFIIRSTMEQRITRVEMALKGAAEPFEAICAFVRTGVQLNTEFRRETIIGDRELSRLPTKSYVEVVRIRDKWDGILTEIIVEGVESGVFSVPDPRVATFAIVGMLSRICNWYKPSGRLSEADLQGLYVEYALRIVGAQPPGAKKPATAAKLKASAAVARRKSSRVLAPSE